VQSIDVCSPVRSTHRRVVRNHPHGMSPWALWGNFPHSSNPVYRDLPDRSCVVPVTRVPETGAQIAGIIQSMPPRVDRMSSWKWFWLSFLGGGVAFWIPDVMIPALNRNEQGLAVTIACPTLLILFYAAALHIRKLERFGPSTAIFALSGTWVLAPSFTLVAQWVRSQEGLGEFTWGDFGYLLLSSFLPTHIFMAAALEGSLFALVIGTVTMVIGHRRYERTRWIIPPGLWGAFHHSKK
jgi:hypothetical protein